MSRTIRRKNAYYEYYWVLRDWDFSGEYLKCIPIEAKSNVGKQRLAKFHSDANKAFQEPGPSWFRNLTTERPQRRDAKRQLHRYLQGEDIEVILNPQDKLDYWT